MVFAGRLFVRIRVSKNRWVYSACSFEYIYYQLLLPNISLLIPLWMIKSCFPGDLFMGSIWYVIGFILALLFRDELNLLLITSASAHALFCSVPRCPPFVCFPYVPRPKFGLATVAFILLCFTRVVQFSALPVHASMFLFASVRYVPHMSFYYLILCHLISYSTVFLMSSPWTPPMFQPLFHLFRRYVLSSPWVCSSYVFLLFNFMSCNQLQLPPYSSCHLYPPMFQPPFYLFRRYVMSSPWTQFFLSTSCLGMLSAIPELAQLFFQPESLRLTHFFYSLAPHSDATFPTSPHEVTS